MTLMGQSGAWDTPSVRPTNVGIRTNRYALTVATEAAPQRTGTPVTSPEVTIVIPVLNEEATLEELWRGIAEAVDGASISAEAIFVDDGSTDRTMALLEQLHARDERVRVVSF